MPSADVVHVAALVALSGCAAQSLIVVEPSVNITVPPGWPLPGAVTATAAMNVNGCPFTPAPTVEVSPTEVAAFSIVNVPAVYSNAYRGSTAPEQWVACVPAFAPLATSAEHVGGVISADGPSVFTKPV